MEKFLCPSDRSGPISQDGLATFVRSPNDPQFISCTILAFAFFCCFFYIHFALFCHISGDGIAATKSTIFPLAPSWLLHFSHFCVLKYFLPYCVIFQKMAWQRKSPMIYNLSLSANFSSPNQFCFLLIAFFSYFQIRILTDMQKKVLLAIFFYQNTLSRGYEFQCFAIDTYE